MEGGKEGAKVWFTRLDPRNVQCWAIRSHCSVRNTAEKRTLRSCAEASAVCRVLTDLLQSRYAFVFRLRRVSGAGTGCDLQTVG